MRLLDWRGGAGRRGCAVWDAYGRLPSGGCRLGGVRCLLPPQPPPCPWPADEPEGEGGEEGEGSPAPAGGAGRGGRGGPAAGLEAASGVDQERLSCEVRWRAAGRVLAPAPGLFSAPVPPGPPAAGLAGAPCHAARRPRPPAPACPPAQPPGGRHGTPGLPQAACPCSLSPPLYATPPPPLPSPGGHHGPAGLPQAADARDRGEGGGGHHHARRAGCAAPAHLQPAAEPPGLGCGVRQGASSPVPPSSSRAFRRLPTRPLCTPTLSLPALPPAPGVSKSYTLEAGAGGQQTLQTDGINVRGVWPSQDLVDVHRLSTNSPAAMLAAYGVEACRATIVKEVRPGCSSACLALRVGVVVLYWPAAPPSSRRWAAQDGRLLREPATRPPPPLALCFITWPPPPHPAARRRQVSAVFGAYGIGVDPRHLSLIADFMTHLVRRRAAGGPARLAGVVVPGCCGAAAAELLRLACALAWTRRSRLPRRARPSRCFPPRAGRLPRVQPAGHRGVHEPLPEDLVRDGGLLPGLRHAARRCGRPHLARRAHRAGPARGRGHRLPGAGAAHGRRARAAGVRLAAARRRRRRGCQRACVLAAFCERGARRV